MRLFIGAKAGHGVLDSSPTIYQAARAGTGRADHLRWLACVGLVLLFGSYARGDWKEEGDLPAMRSSGHASDYDLLAVAEACNHAGLSTHVRIIHTELGYLNQQLAKGQYFYSEIVSEGCVLYRDFGFDLAEPVTPDRQAQLQTAREGFNHWSEKARRFYEIHKTPRENGWLPESAFHLHQAAEAAYKAVLLVFTGYIPNEHYLELLGQKAAEVDARFANPFPRDSTFQSDAVSLLDYAYIGARYDPQYCIDELTLSYLAERVAALLALSETACREKIATLQNCEN